MSGLSKNGPGPVDESAEPLQVFRPQAQPLVGAEHRHELELPHLKLSVEGTAAISSAASSTPPSAPCSVGRGPGQPDTARRQVKFLFVLTKLSKSFVGRGDCLR
jgi:hypothetical protein